MTTLFRSLFFVNHFYTYLNRLDVCINDKNIVMCPSCDDGCEYWQLKENCKHSMMTYLFDNAATVCFSIFMALWSAAFLELWKR